MHAKLLGVLATLVALGAAAPHRGQQKALSFDKSLYGGTVSNTCLKVCWPAEPTCPDRWEPKNFGDEDQPCWTCCFQDQEELIKISEKNAAADSDICLRVCWLEEPTCPDGWEQKKFGDCFTCCRKDQEDLVKISEKSAAADSNICLMVCWPEEPTCPDRWEAKELGEGCWTCCHKDQEELVKISEKSAAADGPPCLMVCLPEEPNCPDGWEQKKLGECWTCCRNSGQEVAKSLKSAAIEGGSMGPTDLNILANLRGSQHKPSDRDPCLLVCFHEKPDCNGSGQYAQKFGECWTCCFEIDRSLDAVTLGKSDSRSSLSHSSSKLLSASREVCLMVCLIEKPDCAEPSHAKQFGECWTCCVDLDRDSGSVPLVASKAPSMMTLVEKHSSSKQLSAPREVCLLICLPMKPECAQPSYSKQLGECWTCCTDLDAHGLPYEQSKLALLEGHHVSKHTLDKQEPKAAWQSKHTPAAKAMDL